MSRWSYALVIAGLMSAMSTSHATVLVLMDSPTLAAKSDVIVVGHVTRKEAAWEGDRIITHVTFAVERTVKGQPDRELTLAVDGGTVNGITMRTIGGAEFGPTDRSLLFLRRRSVGDLVVTGLAQGKLDVLRARDGIDRVRWTRTNASSLVPLNDALVEIAAKTRAP